MGSDKKKQLFDNEEESSSSDSSSSSDDSSSSSSSSSEEEEKDIKLTVNKSYAKAYQSRKQKEELTQARQRNDYDSDEDSSSSEEEDENANLLTPAVNFQFAKTMKALRNKDSSIYDPKTEFFEDGNNMDEAEESSGKKKKPKKFKDVLRDQILEQMDEDQPKDDGGDGSDPTPSRFAYDQQQEEIRKAFLKETENMEGGDSDDENDWMIVKNKGSSNATKDPEAEERAAKELESLEEMIKGSKQKDFVDPRGEIDDGDKFLLDYIKQQKWKSTSDDEQADSDEDEASNNNGNVSDDDSFVDKADDFEASYNFRFEQAAAETGASGAAFSNQSYARGQTMKTLRRKDETRREKRLARKERKAAERKAKEEQLKRLKNAKKAEMDEKLNKVKKVLGEVGDDDIDEAAIMKMMEGDFDPDKFEEAMKTAYGDDYYAQEDKEWKSDKDVVESLRNDEDGDVVVGQDDMDGALYDNYDEEEQEGAEYDEHNEDYDEEHDGDEDWNGDEEQEEQEMNPLEQKIKSKMQEELYKLDYEDIVAGMPTRFKYRQVEANDYGLSAEEILFARDTTLKQFVSLKKMAPYNESGEFHADSKQRRRFREMLKNDLEEEQKLAEGSNNGEGTDDAEPTETEDVDPSTSGKKKRRRLKKGKKKDKENDSPKTSAQTETTNEAADADQDKTPDQTEQDGGEKKSKKRRKKRKKSEAGVDSSSSTKESSAKEVSPEKKTGGDKKRRKKKKSFDGISASRLDAYGL